MSIKASILLVVLALLVAPVRDFVEAERPPRRGRARPSAARRGTARDFTDGGPPVARSSIRTS
jgi:hypothetical protein